MLVQPGVGVIGHPTAVITWPCASPPEAWAVLAPWLQPAHMTTAKAAAATLPDITRMLVGPLRRRSVPVRTSPTVHLGYCIGNGEFHRYVKATLSLTH